jgi:hypothetical protein
MCWLMGMVFQSPVELGWVRHRRVENSAGETCSNLQKMAHPWAKKCTNLGPNYQWLVPLPERNMPSNRWKSVLHLLFEK